MKLEQKIWDSRREKCKGLNFLIFPRFFFGDASITRTRLWNIFDKFLKKNAKRKRLLLVLLATKNTRKGKEVREKSFAKQLVELWPRIPEKHKKLLLKCIFNITTMDKPFHAISLKQSKIVCHYLTNINLACFWRINSWWKRNKEFQMWEFLPKEPSRAQP